MGVSAPTALTYSTAPSPASTRSISAGNRNAFISRTTSIEADHRVELARQPRRAESRATAHIETATTRDPPAPERVVDGIESARIVREAPIPAGREVVEERLDLAGARARPPLGVERGRARRGPHGMVGAADRVAPRARGDHTFQLQHVEARRFNGDAS